ncbi:MAG: type III-B CRISPR module-associated protein Cmr5 [Thermoanaerobaculia bacterium]|nr:type III-B CRISPR module-associated protein Cmr5 [Thermoanaerobaculia bacterium]
MRKGLDQIRAARAYEAAQTLAPLEKGDFVTMAQNLPAMLQINGLLAGWAFLLVKQKKQPGAGRILGTILSHLRERVLGLRVPVGSPDAVFRHWVGSDSRQQPNLSGSDLRRLTAECIAFSAWLKRAAETVRED